MKILLVDDVPESSLRTKALLTTLHYIVDIVTTKVDLVYLLSQFHYDCVITEVIMKETNMLEVCKEIRTRNLSIPIVVLSTLTDHYTTIAAFDAGADDVINKSTDPRELIARLYALNRRKEKPIALAISTYKGLKLNKRHRTVHMHENELELSPTEYRLLELLMEIPEKIFTRDEILEQIWDMYVDSYTNKVDVFINFLRKKLQNYSSPGEQYIQTIRGFGYRLACKE